MCLAVTLEPEIPKPPVVEFLVLLGGDEVGGRLGMIDPPHARSPFRIWAIWIKRMSSPSRSAQPFWCMRHDMSAETMYSAPAVVMIRDLVVTHLGGDRLLENGKSAAEATAFIRSARRHEFDAADLAEQIDRL